MNRYLFLILVFISCDLFEEEQFEVFCSGPYDIDLMKVILLMNVQIGNHIQFAMVMMDVKYDYILTLK